MLFSLAGSFYLTTALPSLFYFSAFFFCLHAPHNIFSCSPVQPCGVPCSDLHFTEPLLFFCSLSFYEPLLIITTKTCSASHNNHLQTHIFALLCLCFMRHNMPPFRGSVMLSMTPRRCQLEDSNAKLWGALSRGQIAISVPNTIKGDS